MMCNESLRDAESGRLPGWILLLAILVIVTSHTQLTIRHLALRLAGVRLGEIHNVMDIWSYTNKDHLYDTRRVILPAEKDHATTAVIFDPVAVYIPAELKGKQLYLWDRQFEILDNTETHILVRADAEKLAKCKQRHYRTGDRNPGVLEKLALRTPALNATPGDVALGLLAFCLVIWALQKGKLGDINPPPIMTLLFIVACVCSLVGPLRLFDTSMVHPNIRAGIKELLQYVEVFVVAWAVLTYAFRDRDTREVACWAFGLCAGLCVALGMMEYVAVFKGWTLHGLLDIMEIDSAFGIRYNPRRAWMTGSDSSKNVLAAYLLIVLPFLTGLVMACKAKGWRYALSACILLGFCLVLHLWLLVCVLGACLLVLMLDGRRRVIASGVMVALGGLTMICIVNKHHGKFLLDSVAVRRTKDVYGLIPMPMKGQKLKGDKAWQQKFTERQAAMNAIGFSPILGLGIGNYQKEINQFFANSKVEGHDMEKSPQNLMEHDSHSLYQVQAVETGVVGLVLLVMLLAGALLKALRVWHTAQDPVAKAICAGAAGTATALILGSVFCSFLARGIQLLAIAILVLPYAIEQSSAQSPAIPDEDKVH